MNDVESELKKIGLNVSITIQTHFDTWIGSFDGSPFTITISPRNPIPKGHRAYLIVSMANQCAEKAIPLLSQLMGYKPFCNYRYANDQEQFLITHEWARDDREDRLISIHKDSDIVEFQEITS